MSPGTRNATIAVYAACALSSILAQGSCAFTFAFIVVPWLVSVPGAIVVAIVGFGAWPTKLSGWGYAAFLGGLVVVDVLAPFLVGGLLELGLLKYCPGGLGGWI